jgi:putative NADH-flavin reductase
MKIAVLGVTGRTGRLVAQSALDRGYAVRGLARDPKKLDLRHERLAVIEGDAHDPNAVRRLLEGSNAVVSALGPNGDAANVCSTATKLVLKAMQETGIRRYVVVSGAGLDFPGDRKKFGDKLVGKMIRFFQPATVADKEAELQVLLGAPGIDWVLARPPRLVDGPARGSVRVSTDRPQSVKISRQDLASFLLDQIDSKAYIRCAPFVSN